MMKFTAFAALVPGATAKPGRRGGVSLAGSHSQGISATIVEDWVIGQGPAPTQHRGGMHLVHLQAPGNKLVGFMLAATAADMAPVA